MTLLYSINAKSVQVEDATFTDATFTGNQVVFSGETPPSITAEPSGPDHMVKNSHFTDRLLLSSNKPPHVLSNMPHHAQNGTHPRCLDPHGYYQLAVFYVHSETTIRRAGCRGDVNTSSSATTGALYLVKFASNTSSQFTVLAKTNDFSNPFQTANHLLEDHFRDENGEIAQFTFSPGDKVGVILYTNETNTSNQHPIRGIATSFGSPMASNSEGELAAHGTYYSSTKTPPTVGSSYFMNSGYAFYMGRFWLEY